MKDLHAQIEKGELSSLRIILKSDVQGSVEALCDSLKKLATEEVSLEVIHSGSGGINENDVNLAAASNALILGLHVRPTATARSLAEREGVDIHTYQLIYEAIDQTKKAMEGLLKPEFKEVFSGRCRVKQIFKIPDVGTVAGCSVYDGKIPRDSNVRILRDNVIIYEGKISSLKRFKDDVKEVSAGFECGVGFEKFSNIKEDDEIESFVMERVERKL